MERRLFLSAGPALALAGCRRFGLHQPEISVTRPGRDVGHALRDGRAWPSPSAEHRADTVIVGSGIAGLSAAWTLARAGHRDVVLIAGPEPLGNAAAGQFAGVEGTRPFPTGAHYLPLPSMESMHVREMLAAFGVLEAGLPSTHPRYDERVLVHAPDARVRIDGKWQPGLLPEGDKAEAEQQTRFFGRIAEFSAAKGADGRRAFAVPLALSSRDPALLSLDKLTFANWLDAEKLDAPGLRWYLDYCCRDDYGAGASKVSAWAGLHYFAGRSGHAENASDGTFLTWPSGLAPLATFLRDDAVQRGVREMTGHALRVSVTPNGASVVLTANRGETTALLRARKVICAMPLHVATRVVQDLPAYLGRAVHPPSYAPWIVANHLLEGFPREADDTPLAWDNVIRGSRSLGFVNASHQDIRLARPANAVFTTYHALSDPDPETAHKWLARATEQDLADLVTADLEEAYGRDYRRRIRRIDITVRGHAMAIPEPGFLSRPEVDALRKANGPLLFAHADLSGLSVFEEAAWWGRMAAWKAMGQAAPND